MGRAPLQLLATGPLLEVLSFLSSRELYLLGCSCRKLFMIFFRERESRKALTGSTSRFLAPGWRRETVCLASYPRSGNSLLRRVLESWSGAVSGSDSLPNRTLSASLLRCGFRGEGVIDESVWLVKTHFPERRGYAPFVAHRAVLIVRNPFDAIESYFHMGMTNTHDKSLSSTSFEGLQYIWKEFIMNEILVWKKFHEYWLNGAKVLSNCDGGIVLRVHGADILVVRFEDLLLKKKKVQRILSDFLRSGGAQPLGLKFAAQKNSINSQEKYLSAEEPGYSPRQTGSVGKSLPKYSKCQVEGMRAIADNVLSCLGYNLSFATEHGDSCEKRIFLTPIDSSNFELFNSSCEKQSKKHFDHYHQSFSDDGHLNINNSYNLRSEDDKFGRKITTLRKSLTFNDCEPFETL